MFLNLKCDQGAELVSYGRTSRYTPIKNPYNLTSYLRTICMTSLTLPAAGSRASLCPLRHIFVRINSSMLYMLCFIYDSYYSLNGIGLPWNIRVSAARKKTTGKGLEGGLGLSFDRLNEEPGQWTR